VEKILYLRAKYHLGPIRIVWYLARYHSIKISEAGVSRILKRYGVSRLPRGTRVRKVHTIRYSKQGVKAVKDRGLSHRRCWPDGAVELVLK
jgi:hypothetical protein